MVSSRNYGPSTFLYTFIFTKGVMQSIQTLRPNSGQWTVISPKKCIERSQLRLFGFPAQAKFQEHVYGEKFSIPATVSRHEKIYYAKYSFDKVQPIARVKIQTTPSPSILERNTAHALTSKSLFQIEPTYHSNPSRSS